MFFKRGSIFILYWKNAKLKEVDIKNLIMSFMGKYILTLFLCLFFSFQISVEPSMAGNFDGTQTTRSKGNITY